MSMNVFRPRDFFVTSPVERYFGHVLDRAMRDFDRGMAPYWLDVPTHNELAIGNATGKVIDDKEKFGVEVNVSQFRPEELSVNVREKELIVEGHHEERSDHAGTIERHFIRKYIIPDDVQMDTIQSELTDTGVLRVKAKKLAVEGPPSRQIPIQMAQKNNGGGDAPKADGN